MSNKYRSTPRQEPWRGSFKPMATAKLFLDTRYASKETEKPVQIKIAINHRNSSSNILTGLKILPSQWDKVTCKITSHPQKTVFNRMLQQQLGSVCSIIERLNLQRNLNELTASELCHLVQDELNPHAPKPYEKPEKPKENPNTVAKFFTRYKENKGLRERTLAMYDVTWRRIEAWLGKEAAEKLEFTDINITWIEDFDKFLSQTAQSANGRRIHHANLKAVIGYAIDHEVLDRNPYRRYKIKTEQTKKRNMSVEALRMIIFAKDLEPWMEKYRDFFVLSFMFRGLNTVDLCHLTKAVDGRVDWVRTKTSQPLSLKIEPEMQMIIDKYQGDELMLSFAEHRNYRNFNEKLSKALHRICEHINEHRNGGVEVPDFTMYWARHTWATLAHKLDISMDVIGSGLAHSPKSVTEIYIERDPEKIDIANRRVLDYVLYNKDYRIPEEPAKKKRGRPRKIA